MDPRLELVRGRHVYLREMHESDAPHIVEWRNRPDTREWLPQWEPLTVDAHLSWFARRVDAGDLLLVFVTLAGQPVGSASLQGFDRSGESAEWGRLVAARIGGHPHGILEGCYLLHRLCFEALKMLRLYAVTGIENQRSWRLCQFLGWRQEGVLRKHYLRPDGTRLDVRAMGCFTDEFAAARPAVEAKLYDLEAPIPVIPPTNAARLREHLRVDQRGH